MDINFTWIKKTNEIKIHLLKLPNCLQLDSWVININMRLKCQVKFLKSAIIDSTKTFLLLKSLSFPFILYIQVQAITCTCVYTYTHVHVYMSPFDCFDWFEGFVHVPNQGVIGESSDGSDSLCITVLQSNEVCEGTLVYRMTTKCVTAARWVQLGWVQIQTLSNT